MWEYNNSYQPDEIYHYGIKGMKWGVRRRARKDAKEFARAKMFYGEGAGTRRKLIKNTVNQRSKDPVYKKEFDTALAKQDMAKHASKAKKERKIKDTKKAAGKIGRSAINIVTDHPERLGAAAAGVYGAYRLANKTGVDKVIIKNAKKAYNSVKNAMETEIGRRKCEEMMRNWKVVD